ncbi:MAG: hypothetical protein CMO16_03615 [Thaumarchaeota archaeon]|nr:hypothetical protein [Nitrososphaerota archaeon]|tara:strand:- start:1372 stop:2478 length:1107 start_codon:yes stop_codon:yes gene_type:complete
MVLAAVFNTPNEPLELKEFPKPEPEEGAIFAKIISAGICGTDIHVISGKVPWVPTPIILGHESVGIIEKLGDKVTTDSVGNIIKEGDRIYWALGIICGRCFYCMKGTRTRCLNRKAIGLSTPSDKPPHLQGGFAEYIYLSPQVTTFKLPDSLPTTALSSVGCAGPTVIAAVENVRIDFDDVVAVQGTGPVGSFAIVMAKERGARHVIAIDSAERLHFAKKIGADDVVDIKSQSDQKERVKKIKELAGGHGPDVIMDCTGNPKALPEAIDIVRDGGRVLELGAYADYGPSPINPYFITSRQISIIGSYSKIPRHEYEFVNFMAKKWKSYPFNEMVTHQFPLKEINQAIDIVKNRQGMKVLVTPSGPLSK